jgi:hypothetical protein
VSYSSTLDYSVTGNTLKLTASQSGVRYTYTFKKTKIIIGAWSPPANSIPLTNGQWSNGSINIAGGEQWYSLSVTAGTTYRVWWNDEYEGDYSKTLDIEVSAFYSDGTAIFRDEDEGWDYPESFTPTSSGTVYIKVTAYNDDDTGTYAIAYNTSGTRP